MSETKRITDAGIEAMGDHELRMAIAKMMGWVGVALDGDLNLYGWLPGNVGKVGDVPDYPNGIGAAFELLDYLKQKGCSYRLNYVDGASESVTMEWVAKCRIIHDAHVFDSIQCCKQGRGASLARVITIAALKMLNQMQAKGADDA